MAAPVPGVTVNLTGTVPAGGTFVLAQGSASAAILALAQQTNGSAWFNLATDGAMLSFTASGPKSLQICSATNSFTLDPASNFTPGHIARIALRTDATTIVPLQISKSKFIDQPAELLE